VAVRPALSSHAFLAWRGLFTSPAQVGPLLIGFVVSLGRAVAATTFTPRYGRVDQAIYELDVTADGRYVADGDGPKEVNGYFQVRTSTGDAPNPLWRFDGNVDLLTSTTKE
jgi:hypothetical protein